MAKAKQETSKIEKENIYVIPIREKIRVVPRYKKTNKAIKTIKEFLAKHMKIYDRDLNKIKIDKYLNEFMWARGIKNPPSKVKVKAVKDVNGIVKVELFDFPDKLNFKKLREEKKEAKALEAVKKKKTMMQKAKEAQQSPATPTATPTASATETLSPKVPEEEKKIGEEKAKEEKKAEEKEKVKSVEEATKQLEKAQAKQMKKAKQPKVKQPKHQQRKALAK